MGIRANSDQNIDGNGIRQEELVISAMMVDQIEKLTLRERQDCYKKRKMIMTKEIKICQH